MQVKTVSPQQVLAKAIKLLESCGLDKHDVDSSILDLVELSRSLPTQLSIKPAPLPPHQVKRPDVQLPEELIEAAKAKAEEERKADIARVNKRKRRRRALLQQEINKKKPVLSLEDLFA